MEGSGLGCAGTAAITMAASKVIRFLVKTKLLQDELPTALAGVEIIRDIQLGGNGGRNEPLSSHNSKVKWILPDEKA